MSIWVARILEPVSRFRFSNSGIFWIFDPYFGFWTPGLVPQGAHRDFLQVPGLNASRSSTWFRKWPGILAGNLAGQHFVNFWSPPKAISPGSPEVKWRHG